MALEITPLPGPVGITPQDIRQNQIAVDLTFKSLALLDFNLNALAVTGNVGIGTTASNLNGHTRELVVSAGTVAPANAGISIQGALTATDIFGQLNFFHKTNCVTLVAGGRDGADNSGFLRFYTANAGTLTNQMSIDKTGAVAMAGPLAVSGATTLSGALTSGGTAGGYDEGTFTGTLTGCTTSPTGTLRYVRIGKLVTLMIPKIVGYSNTTSATITGMPASIRPARRIGFHTETIQDDSYPSTLTQGLYIETSGIITLVWAASTIGFTNFNSKGFFGTIDANANVADIPFTYTLQ